MGAVVDEDSGEPVLCPYCGKEGECPHLLAIIDHSFGEVRAGEAFRRGGAMLDAVERGFERRLGSLGDPPARWRDPLLDELWDSAVEARRTAQGGDPVYIDLQIFYYCLAELLEMAGGLRYPGTIIEDGGPGFTSSLTILHARDPARVFDQALGDFKGGAP